MVVVLAITSVMMLHDDGCAGCGGEDENDGFDGTVDGHGDGDGVDSALPNAVG